MRARHGGRLARTRQSGSGDLPGSAEPILEARGLSVGYGPIAVVRELDLVVYPGEVVALLGANGAGKTTTLKALAGLLPTTAGAVLFKGEPTRKPLFERSRAGLAYVPEERGIFRGLTTLENLRLGRGQPEVALDLMPELRSLLHRRAGLLSGGEQQMLAVARALASQPRILLCDELSLGLAPMVVKRILEGVRAAANTGVSVLLVEQQARTALSVAHRAYVLNRGRLAMVGETRDLLSRFDELEQHYLSGLSH